MEDLGANLNRKKAAEDITSPRRNPITKGDLTKVCLYAI
jgi:hypothetical protein